MTFVATGVDGQPFEGAACRVGESKAYCLTGQYAFTGGDKGHWTTLEEAKAGCNSDPSCEGFYSNGGVFYKSGKAYQKYYKSYSGTAWKAWVKPGVTPTGVNGRPFEGAGCKAPDGDADGGGAADGGGGSKAYCLTDQFAFTGGDKGHWG